MPADNPLVTIVVLTYHKFDGIRKNLESIGKQNYPNIEVIIQDDGSPNFDKNHLEKLCEDSLGSRKWIIHQNEKNMGTVRSFNTAVFMANGEFIVPLSQDDVFFDENVVGKIVTFFQTHSECMSCTSKRKGEKSKRIYPNQGDIELLERWNQKELWSRILYENFISGSTIYYRTDFLRKRGGFDTEFLLVEDYPFVAAMVLENHKIGFLDEITIVYGEEGVSNGTVPSPKMLADRMIFYDKYVLPNMNLTSGKWMKRYVKYLYGDIRYRNKIVYRALHNLWNWQVLIRMLYGIYIKKLNVEERYVLWKK